MKHGKTFLALAMVLCVAALMLAGCAPKTDANSPAVVGSISQAPAPAGPVKLRVLLPAWDDVRKQMNREFIQPALEEKFPDYEFEFEEYIDAAKLSTYNATGDLPDVFFSGALSSTLPIINAQAAEDLLPYITADGFADKYKVKNVIEPWTDGKVYTLTSGSDSYFTPRLYINKSMFAANGVAVPKTFDEFVAACEAFKAKGITPLSSHTFEGWAVNGFLWQTFAMAANPQTVLDFYNGKIGFTDPAVVEAFGRIEQLAKLGALPEGCPQMDYGATINLFKSKKVPMYMMFSWTMPELEIDADVDFIPFPSISPDVNMDDYTQFWGGPLAGFGVSANSKFKAAAVQVAEECTMQEAIFFNTVQNALTALDTGNEIKGLSELAQKNVDVFEKAANKIPSLTFIYSPKVVTELGIQGGKLLLGQTTAQEVCEALEKIRQEG